MSDEINTPQGGGEALPAVTQDPKADAAAVATPTTPATPTEPTAEQKAAADKAEAERVEGEKKRNRTRDYINKLNGDNADLRRRLADLETRSQPQAQHAPQQHQQQAERGPTLEEFNYDLTAFQQARDQWVIQQAEKGWTAKQQQQAAQQREQATWSTYETKAAEFADTNPDFLEVVSSIAYPLTDAAQAAIAAHENGPAIAYHLGNNDDDAYELARTPPHLADAAVRRLATRLSAAPPPVIPAAQAPAKPKPITQAPAPAPTVSGRSPTEIPPEKMTDDQWFERRKADSRKR